MSELKQTSLHDLHLTLGAKIVEFAGFHMPLHYSAGIIKEHLHCRKMAAFFDVSHMGQCLVKGENVAQALETLTPCDLQNLNPGQQRYIIMTNTHGGIIDDMIVSRLESTYLLIVNAASKEKVFNHLKQRLSTRCSIEVLDHQSLLAFQGPMAASILQSFAAPISKLSFMQVMTTEINQIPCMISRSGYTGEDGFEISVENNYAQKLANIILDCPQVLPVGLGARDTLRLEAGLCLYGHELSETISPVEAGLKWTFRKQANDYLGHHIISEQLATGANRKRVGILFDGKRPVRSNTILYDKNDNQIGILTSGNHSPCLGKPIGLGLIDTHYHEPLLFAQVGKQIISGTITVLPFVPHHYMRS